MPSSRKKNAFQIEAARIFQAQRSAERLLDRTQAERGVVMSLSRDELSALAQQMVAVSEIASRYHLERATAGGVAPEIFAEPV